MLSRSIAIASNCWTDGFAEGSVGPRTLFFNLQRSHRALTPKSERFGGQPPTPSQRVAINVARLPELLRRED